MLMAAADDVTRMAELLGVRVPRDELEKEAPQIRSLLRDQETLLGLPLDDREPALTPVLYRGRVWDPE
jgi:predicted ATP-grasp superfamily ATP-dependent carboligase